MSWAVENNPPEGFGELALEKSTSQCEVSANGFPSFGEKSSNGCLHADSWSSVPFPRMPNVSLAPSEKETSAEELIADVKNGIMIHGRGSYSIDQQRYNFQFGGQTFWEIKNGKVTGMLKDVAYQSRTTDFPPRRGGGRCGR
jgi:hypothetical protein